MRNISQHVTWHEGVHSETAIRKNIKNIPNDNELVNMKMVANKVFEPIRNNFNCPIAITSFFRCSKLNTVLGGSKTSQHKIGQAIDMNGNRLGRVSNSQIFNYILNNLDFDQLIWEYGTDNEPDWVHVSYKQKGNRKKVLKAVRGKGYVNYKG
jgi:hypothetical protein